MFEIAHVIAIEADCGEWRPEQAVGALM